MVLEQIEKESILALLNNYRQIHDGLSTIEDSINIMQKSLTELLNSKDALINNLEENREGESTLIKGLVEKYGEGKLNLENFEWIINSK